MIWSHGHRNIQGLAWDSSGRLYASEFGSSSFDEVNLIEKGGNYGWPEVEGVGGDSRFIDPIVTWSTSEASPPAWPTPTAPCGSARSAAGSSGASRSPRTARPARPPRCSTAGTAASARSPPPPTAPCGSEPATRTAAAPRPDDDRVLTLTP
nr:hypothetical protein GCM10020093_056320 [Planobispora longispora]